MVIRMPSLAVLHNNIKRAKIILHAAAFYSARDIAAHYVAS